MDSKLVAWARSVKARQAQAALHRPRSAAERLPALWLFADPQRLPDPCAAAAALPRGLCGVVLRADPGPARGPLGRRLRRICRERRLCLSVAADWRSSGDWRWAAALGGRMHLRAGRRPPAPRWCQAVTGSAHNARELRRARRAGVDLVFLSPLFATASHPGGAALGAVRWAALAGPQGAAALGGIGGATLRALPTTCHGAGAINALTPRAVVLFAPQCPVNAMPRS